MLDETSKRKPNFSEPDSVRVVLADGQPWAVPKPWLEVRPVFHRSVAVSSWPAYTYSPELDRLIERVAEADGFYAEVAAVATLAAELLCWHYDLADADLDQLLAYRSGDPASLEWTGQVIEIATGRSGPKAGSAGGT